MIGVTLSVGERGSSAGKKPHHPLPLGKLLGRCHVRRLGTTCRHFNVVNEICDDNSKLSVGADEMIISIVQKHDGHQREASVRIVMMIVMMSGVRRACIHGRQ
eukprot:556936-Pyramimonas_sp.AAC.1